MNSQNPTVCVTLAFNVGELERAVGGTCQLMKVGHNPVLDLTISCSSPSAGDVQNHCAAAVHVPHVQGSGHMKEKALQGKAKKEQGHRKDDVVHLSQMMGMAQQLNPAIR